MTVFSLVRPGGVQLLRLVLRIGRELSGDKTRRLSFIHFARLTIIRRFPDHGQPRERIRHPLLMFESNYDGPFADYIDVFATKIPFKMRAFWGTSYGWPGVDPVTPFKRYISENEFEVQHYYSAYPEASTTMVAAALALRGPHAEFRRRALADDRADRFEADFRAFVSEVQSWL